MLVEQNASWKGFSGCCVRLSIVSATQTQGQGLQPHFTGKQSGLQRNLMTCSKSYRFPRAAPPKHCPPGSKSSILSVTTAYLGGWPGWVHSVLLAGTVKGTADVVWTSGVAAVPTHSYVARILAEGSHTLKIQIPQKSCGRSQQSAWNKTLEPGQLSNWKDIPGSWIVSGASRLKDRLGGCHMTWQHDACPAWICYRP